MLVAKQRKGWKIREEIKNKSNMGEKSLIKSRKMKLMSPSKNKIEPQLEKHARFSSSNAASSKM